MAAAASEHYVALVVLGFCAAVVVVGLGAVLGVGRRRLERRGGLLECDSRRALTLGWTCMICGRLRPDSEIAVASAHEGWVTMNVRHCAGDESCRAAAQTRALAEARRLGRRQA